MANPLDWSLLQSFLAVAEAGSLSAAARASGQSQPTLGRHIRAAEERLGVTLFERQPKGLRLTEAGQDLLPSARAMQAAAAEAALAAAGRDTALRGTVRITASAVVSHYLLPPVIARMRAAEPLIQIELVSSDTTENLLFREADIALRMYRPDQLDIVARRLRPLPLAIFAATSYLDRVGRPQNLEEMMALDWVGMDRNDLMLRGMRDLGMGVTREFFPVRCDDQPANWLLVRAGCGVGVTQAAIGDADPLVERLLPGIGLALPELELWIAAPEALRSTPRIRRVWDLLVGHFAA